MSNPTWPTTLPIPIQDGSMQYAPFIQPVISTSMESGAPKFRRRFTNVYETLVCTIELTSAQLSTLFDFIVTTLGDVGEFDWKDFRDGSAATYVFVQRPAAVGIANRPGYWSVSLDLLKVA